MKFSRILAAAAAASFISASAGCSNTKKVTSTEIDPLAVRSQPTEIVYDWQEPYSATLSAFRNSDRYTDKAMFEILDLTGDDVPELIISPSDEVSAQCEIYRFIGSGADLIATSGSFGSFDYIPSLNAIGFSYNGEGFVMGEYQTYQEGSFNTDISFYNNSDSASAGAHIRYEINNENVSLTRYQEALFPYQEAFTIKVGRKFSLGDEAIDYALHYSESWSQVLTDDQKKLYKDYTASVMNASELKDAAFEIVDLDLSGLPEVVISTGMLNDSEIKILYLDSDGVKELSTSPDASGGICFDVKAKIFYAADFFGTIQCWSLAGADINGFTPSESTMRCGRKYDLTAENIEKAFT